MKVTTKTKKRENLHKQTKETITKERITQRKRNKIEKINKKEARKIQPVN